MVAFCLFCRSGLWRRIRCCRRRAVLVKEDSYGRAVIVIVLAATDGPQEGSQEPERYDEAHHDKKENDFHTLCQFLIITLNTLKTQYEVQDSSGSALGWMIIVTQKGDFCHHFVCNKF